MGQHDFVSVNNMVHKVGSNSIQDQDQDYLFCPAGNLSWTITKLLQHTTQWIEAGTLPFL